MNKTLKRSDLFVDPSDNPRVDYKALPSIQSKIEQQGFDDSFPIQVIPFKGPDGEKFKVVGGFTRVKACDALKLDEIPAKVVKYSPVEVLRNHLTSNSGNPLTQSEQGKVFAQIRDYGTDPDKLTKGEKLREKPLTVAEVARFTGYSGEHVRNCIMIAEAPKGIRELLESGKVSANAVVDASKGVKDTKTVRKILEAAVEAAGDSVATNKHVKEVKSQLVESKPLKGKTSREASSHDKVRESVETACKEVREQGNEWTDDERKELSKKALDKAVQPDRVADTSHEQQSLIQSPSPKRDQIIAIITAACNKRDGMDLDDDEIEYLAGELLDVF